MTQYVAANLGFRRDLVCRSLLPVSLLPLSVRPVIVKRSSGAPGLEGRRQRRRQRRSTPTCTSPDPTPHLPLPRRGASPSRSSSRTGARRPNPRHARAHAAGLRGAKTPPALLALSPAFRLKPRPYIYTGKHLFTGKEIAAAVLALGLPEGLGDDDEASNKSPSPPRATEKAKANKLPMLIKKVKAVNALRMGSAVVGARVQSLTDGLLTGMVGRLGARRKDTTL